MNHTTYTWKSYDGLSLFGQSWMPDNPPLAVINYVHGFKDYSSRFEKWADRFVERGFGVIAIDLRGHGYSQGRRGYAPGFESYLKDAGVLIAQSEILFPGHKQILYGHSLGGNIVANYLISQSRLPAVAVIASPWFSLTVNPSLLKMAMAHMMRYLMPGVLVKSDLEARYLSRNDEVVEKYTHDPLVHHTILPKLFIEIEKNGALASGSIYKINIPLLVMHGDEDKITSIRCTRNFVRNSSSLTSYKEWPGGYHELHHEPNETEVFDYVVQWLNCQVKYKAL